MEWLRDDQAWLEGELEFRYIHLVRLKPIPQFIFNALLSHGRLCFQLWGLFHALECQFLYHSHHYHVYEFKVIIVHTLEKRNWTGWRRRWIS